jgi:HSP20 family protein
MTLLRLWAARQDLSSDAFSAPDIAFSPPDIGAGRPAINVAETKDAFEVTAELPGVDEKDIDVSLDGDRLVISGEKKAESTTEEKDWHVEERSLGSFYRSISLPFEPENGALDAYFDKGVLHLTIKKSPIGTRSALYRQC